MKRPNKTNHKRASAFSRWALALDLKLADQGLPILDSEERRYLIKNWHPGKTADSSIKELQQARSRDGSQKRPEHFPLAGQALQDEVNKRLAAAFAGKLMQPKNPPRALRTRPVAALLRGKDEE